MSAVLAAACSAALVLVQFRLMMRHLEGTCTRGDQITAMAIAAVAAVPIAMTANGLFGDPFAFVFIVILGTCAGVGLVNAVAMEMSFADRRRGARLRSQDCISYD